MSNQRTQACNNDGSGSEGESTTVHLSELDPYLSYDLYTSLAQCFESVIGVHATDPVPDPPKHRNLNGDPKDVCPMEYLPVIPNARVVVRDNIEIYRRCLKPSARDVERTRAMKRLDHKLGLTLKALFAAHNSLDVWKLVWEGKLAVSGSILLYLLEHMPNQWTVDDFHASDIDVYPGPRVCGVTVNGVVQIQSCGEEWMQSQPPRYRHTCRDLSLENFEQIEPHGIDDEWGDYSAGVWDRKLDQNTPMADRLPNKIQFILSSITKEACEFDFPFLSNYYTQGRLYILSPGAFISRVGILDRNYPTKPGRLTKYRNRGYIVASNPDQIGRPLMMSNLNVERSDFNIDTDIPLNTKWNLTKDNLLIFTAPTSRKDKTWTSKENPLRRLNRPKIDQQNQLIIAIMNMVFGRVGNALSNLHRSRVG